MRRLLPLLIACALAAGCSNRERANPLDPRNPVSRGRPLGFRALASHSAVFLRWDPLPATTDILGFQVYRKTANETAYRAVTEVLDVFETRYGDFGLANGLRHDYRLYYVLEGGLGSSPAEDLATPGPLIPWVADLGAARLVELSADGRRTAAADAAFQGPTYVAVDALNGAVWTSDAFAGTVVLRQTSGLRTVVPFATPASIAVARGGGAWVADEQLKVVRHLDAGGNADGVVLEPFGLPNGIAVDPTDGTVWVCDDGQATVRSFAPNGSALWGTALADPTRVAVDSVSGDGWVTSFERGRVVRVSKAGVPRDTVPGLFGPIGIAVDSRRGRVWVAEAIGGAVTALRLDGSVELRVGGLSEARDVAVDPRTGNAWVAVAGAGAVVVVAPEGRIAQRLVGLDRPVAIAIDWRNR